MKKKSRSIGATEGQGRGDGLTGNGQILLPLLERIQAAGTALEELIQVLGRVGLEAAMELAMPNALGSGLSVQQNRGAPWGPANKPAMEELAGRMMRMVTPPTENVRLAGQERSSRQRTPCRVKDGPSSRPREKDEALERLGERRLQELDLLILYVAGTRPGGTGFDGLLRCRLGG